MQISIIGPNGVGKKTYINRILTGEFDNAQCDNNKFEYKINKMRIPIKLYDYLTQGTDGVILMFDVTNKESYEELQKWYDIVWDTKIPIVLCGNKIDEKNRKVKPKHITFHREKKMQYYDLSCKSNYNFYKPINYLLLQYLQRNLKI